MNSLTVAPNRIRTGMITRDEPRPFLPYEVSLWSRKGRDEKDEITLLQMKKKTILVIDDQKDTGWIMSHIFRDHGDKVIVARSGREGLRKLNQRKELDLVFLDIKLPDLSGLDVLDEIKGTRPKVKVIVITAFGSPEARQEALSRGASRFLDKPIQIEEMIRLTEEVLK